MDAYIGPYRAGAPNVSHNYVGTEHLLPGLLIKNDGVAAQALLKVGLTLETVRKAM